MSALDALKNGDVAAALKQLFAEVRSQPDKAEHRIFLFQLLSVTGELDRALTQLNVARDLDPAAGVMAQAYQEILQCEALRRQVFAGARAPLVFGDPTPWVVRFLEALRVASEGQGDAARELRRTALEEAEAISGTITVVESGEEVEHPFEWIADGDTRLGPTLEIIINGRYYWAPLERVAEVEIEPPADLRDVVWMPAHFRWTNAGEAVGVIPTRYIGTEAESDDALRLARLTQWRETGPDDYEGLGQRVFMTDAGEYGIMDVRRITLTPNGND